MKSSRATNTADPLEASTSLKNLRHRGQLQPSHHSSKPLLTLVFLTYPLHPCCVLVRPATTLNLHYFGITIVLINFALVRSSFLP
ncbi:hypothetical protein EJ08DRAFT_645925 [Tothia fuscella]|uniref:Uncharacterized protein n=1 Tax=Tothia fuscella TaxID=1048955 RepID=A0A9P4NYW9_9PEZI|nr:hypothetical protein EJ08DRAFT_645925 [Tothia fuscella]